MKTTKTIKAKLEYLRGKLRAERISYGELAELQGLGDAGHIPEHVTAPSRVRIARLLRCYGLRKQPSPVPANAREVASWKD